MNYIKHLTGFFDKLVHDYDLNPTHVSLYISLFQFWNLNRFENPISITRDEVMRISKICSKATYHKCMRELHEKGYVIYEPSYNPFRGSMVRMVNLSNELKPLRKKEVTQLKTKQANEQAVNKNKTSDKQALVSSINIINNTNSINNVNIEEQAKNKKNNPFKNYDPLCHPELGEGKNLENTIPPEMSNVIAFFKEKNVTQIDAEKFYNHFQSNGWLVGGKSKMKDWKAAARNWILNSEKFKIQNSEKIKPNHLHVPNEKNYSEPL
ncbi:transcriptional regulator [Flavobacterium nitratireducens]|uniref:transcriptional regulator n=1 Tax=Flavobacterium nitratireducens TaxID=992289 RepID=UPI0024155359|nr:transcriptional regulator [Flavobacterium nitratireducens]